MFERCTEADIGGSDCPTCIRRSVVCNADEMSQQPLKGFIYAMSMWIWKPVIFFKSRIIMLIFFYFNLSFFILLNIWLINWLRLPELSKDGSWNSLLDFWALIYEFLNYFDVLLFFSLRALKVWMAFDYFYGHYVTSRWLQHFLPWLSRGVLISFFLNSSQTRICSLRLVLCNLGIKTHKMNLKY